MYEGAEDSHPRLRVTTVDPVRPLVLELVADLRVALDTHDRSNAGFTATAPNKGHIAGLDLFAVAGHQPGCLRSGVFQAILNPKAFGIGLEDPVAHDVSSLPV
jgi:hypothetical protein